MSIRSSFDAANEHRRVFETDRNSKSLNLAISAFYTTCELISQQGLYSDNENIDDLVSSEIRYLLSEYYLALLLQQQQMTIDDRRLMLQKSLGYYYAFLARCRSYQLVPASDINTVNALLEQEYEDTVKGLSANDRRAQKIRRFQDEKELERNISALKDTKLIDDASVRQIAISSIYLAISKSIQDTEALNLELQLIRTRPDVTSKSDKSCGSRQREIEDSRDWKLDIEHDFLSDNGKVLAPFIITSKRAELSSSVFRSDHSLPTMSIDEYLEIERARGGVIDSQKDIGVQQPKSEEDNEHQLEFERRKAMAWDTFKEENPKGIGNTMNRG